MGNYMYDNKSLWLYGYASVGYPTNSGDWPCYSQTSSFSIPTPYYYGYGENRTQIYRLNPDDTYISVSGHSGDGQSIYVSFTDSNVARQIGMQGGYTVRVCSSSSSIWSGAPIEQAYTGAGWYSFSGISPNIPWWVRVDKTGIGSWHTSDGVRPCNGSSNAVLGTCGCDSTYVDPCANTSSKISDTCGCSTKSSSSCVSGDTLILTKNGEKYAKDITDKDILLSYIDGECVENPQVSIFTMATKESIDKITFEDGSHLFITDKHPILFADGEYRMLRVIRHTDLTALPKVATVDGGRKIKKIESYRNNGTLYNFLVDHDNFIANGVVLACENVDLADDVLIVTKDRAKALPSCNKACSTSLSLAFCTTTSPMNDKVG